MEALSRIERAVQAKYRTDQATVLQSQLAYNKDPEVVAAMDAVAHIFFGEDRGGAASAADVAVPEGMTLDRVRCDGGSACDPRATRAPSRLHRPQFFELFVKHQDAVTAAFHVAIEEAKRVPKAQRNDYMALMCVVHVPPRVRPPYAQAVGRLGAAAQSHVAPPAPAPAAQDAPSHAAHRGGGAGADRPQ